MTHYYLFARQAVADARVADASVARVQELLGDDSGGYLMTPPLSQVSGAYTKQTGPAAFTEGKWSSMAQKLHTFAGSLSSGEQAAFAAHLQELFEQVSAWAGVTGDADAGGFGGPVYAAVKPWNAPVRAESFLGRVQGPSWFPSGFPYW